MYSISDLEKISGIKAHTIRAWEKRYDLLSPQRSDSNVRYYDDKDLDKLLKVSFLKKSGVRISTICNMCPTSLNEELAKYKNFNTPGDDDSILENLVLSMKHIDKNNFKNILDAQIHRNGFEHTLKNLIQPFLDKLMFLWLSGSVNAAQEHFIMNILRQKVIVEIDKLSIPKKCSNTKCLLFLPRAEFMELNLLFLHYTLKSNGFHVVYLGQNVHLDSLIDVYKTYQPDFLFSFITEEPETSTIEYISWLSTSFPDSSIMLSGYQIMKLQEDLPQNISILRDMDETIAFIQNVQKETIS